MEGCAVREEKWVKGGWEGMCGARSFRQQRLEKKGRSEGKKRHHSGRGVGERDRQCHCVFLADCGDSLVMPSLLNSMIRGTQRTRSKLYVPFTAALHCFSHVPRFRLWLNWLNMTEG
jgi:hypothetical protein